MRHLHRIEWSLLGYGLLAALALAPAPAMIGCDSSGAQGDLCASVQCDDGTVCDPISGMCIDAFVRCTVAGDCGDSSKKCSDGVCVSRCMDVTCDTAHGAVCDPDTGMCVGGNACVRNEDCTRKDTFCEDGGCVGKRYAACSPSEPCSKDLDCLTNAVSGSCAGRCTATPECTTAELCVLDSGAGTSANHCTPNLCRPGTDGLADGFQDASYMGPCNATGAGDGVCVGPIPLGTAVGGLCLSSGTAQPGQACNSDAGAGSPQACNRGICLTDNINPNGTCAAVCALFDGSSCPDAQGQPTACLPVFATNGVCVARAVPTPGPGAACTPTTAPIAPCGDDFQCVPARSGVGSSGRPMCATAAQAGQPGRCARGQCIPVGAQNPSLGVCSDI